MAWNKDMLCYHCFSTLIWNAIRRAEENPEGLKLNRTHQLLAYADDVNTVFWEKT
jgi:hypothetical protein